MRLSIRMIVLYNVKHRYAICLKFGGTFLASLTKLVFQVKTSIYSTIKENLLLYCRTFSAFVVSIWHLYHKETLLIKETINFTIESTGFQNRHLSNAHSISDIKLTCFNYVFSLRCRRDVVQCQINVEITFCPSTLESATLSECNLL